MKRVLSTGVLLAFLSCSVLAGGYFMNDTGETVYGLRVEFSEPVTITSFGDVLTVIDPPGESTTFTFAGGAVAPWGDHWIIWEPGPASLLSSEWLAAPPSVEIPEGGLTREDLMNLGRPPTFEEIVAVIAEYPGADEPLYEPAPDQAIWLTDLEGHADIYDNDSIRINYANWFDQSQITRIEVYRNGIKMRFLSEKFDVLTNEQMKTFDGNPQEHSPASSHSDHAIWGYDYELRIYRSGGALAASSTALIQSPFNYRPEYAYANFLLWWDDLSAMRLREFSYSDALETAAAVKSLGIRGASINLEYYMESHEANDIYSMNHANPSVLPENGWTASEEDFREAMRIFREVGLEVDVRMEVWVEGGYGGQGACRQCIVPRSLSTFFDNYTGTAVELARLAAEEGAQYFAPLTEMDSLSPHDSEIRQMLDRINSVFDGTLGIEQSTNAYLRGDSLYDESIQDPLKILAEATFWDWQHLGGEPLTIQMSCWSVRYDDQVDQSFSDCVEGFVDYWMTAVSYYRGRYTDNQLFFGEMGVWNLDGTATGLFPEITQSPSLDDQEVADLWATYLVGCAALGIDGISIWNWSLNPEFESTFRYKPGNTSIMGTPAERIIRAVLGGG